MALRLLRLLAALVTLLCLTSPPATAGPGGELPGPGVCDYPGIGDSSFAAGLTIYWCDFPVEENGSHWHTWWYGWNAAGPGGSGNFAVGGFGFSLEIPVGDFGGGAGGSRYKWPDNTDAPWPNPPGEWKNFLIPKPVPPEHRGPRVPDPPPPEAMYNRGPPIPGLPPPPPPPTPTGEGVKAPIPDHLAPVTNPDQPNPEATENPPS